LFAHEREGEARTIETEGKDGINKIYKMGKGTKKAGWD
jgi:hypothetical protein